MKLNLKLLFLSLFILFSTRGYSQYPTSHLTYEYIQILSYSINVTYSETGNYKPNSAYGVAHTLQARFDQNFEIVEQEYSKLWSLELINNSNKATLNKYKSTIKVEIDTKAGHADFSNSSVTDSWVNFISQPFRISSIKDEIKLLQNCQSELIRIKYNDPDNYIYSKRYKSIAKTLEILENCDPSEIKKISWEYTELNEGNYSFSKKKVSESSFTKNQKETIESQQQANNTTEIVIKSTKFKYLITNSSNRSALGYVDVDQPLILTVNTNSNYSFACFIVKKNKPKYLLTFPVFVYNGKTSVELSTKRKVHYEYFR